MRGRLYKISSTHRNLRTETVDGEAPELPSVGGVFTLLGKGLEFGVRFVETTPIKECTQLGSSFLFKTYNSTYVFDLKEKSDDDQ